MLLFSRDFRPVGCKRFCFAPAFIAAATAVCIAPAVCCAAEPPLPSFEQVQKTVEKQFTTVTDFHSGDVISRDQVAPIFDRLQSIGWQVKDRAEVLKLVPAPDEFFVRELRTPAGRAFMRQSEKYQSAYDRIDRMSHMIMGEQNVKALIRGPDGYKMIQYMTSTQNGRNLGQMLSQDPRGADFNSATGRIYTVDALLRQLAASYEAEQKAREQPQ